jgi:hypothetical protein
LPEAGSGSASDCLDGTDFRISANAVQAATAGVTAATATALKGAGAAGATSVLVKGTLELMRWVKIKAALTAGLGATALAGAVCLVEAPRWTQPNYGGRILSSWLAKLDDGKRENAQEMFWVSWQQTQAGRSAEQGEAVAAIQAMGEKALPYLRATLVKEDGKLDRLEEKIGLSETPAARRRALLALDALGPSAKPLLPQLSECLEGTNCPKEAAAALAAMGPDGWAVLTKGILSTNNNAAPCSIWAVGTHRIGGLEAEAALKYTLTNGASISLDAEAAWALAQIGHDHAELVPLFVNGLARWRWASWGRTREGRYRR